MTRIAVRRALGSALIAVLVATILVTPSVAAPDRAQAVGTTYYPIAGTGSTWSANALQQWIRNVFNNYRWQVSYNDQGSTAGRNLFAQGTQDFAVSEIPYALSGSDAPDPRPSRQFAYMPIVAGGTAFMYNLVIGGKRVTNLRLSGETVTKIFTGVITKWNDPAIAADNPALALPAIGIVPVVRSDGSGTTAQLTTWMRSEHTALWNDYCKRANRSNCGITSNYPIIPGSAFVGQSGSNQVAGFVKQTSSVGSITYVEESYALNARFPVAKILNSAGYYTEPNASNVAVSLLSASINSDPNSPDYLTANLAGVYRSTDPRTYPLSSYSYMIIPTALESGFTENKGLTLADFAAYFLCEGQQQAESLGYSPLPVNLASAGLEQVKKIPGGDPRITSVAGCNNPTFAADGTNKLANEAPQPQACDKKGSTQCLTGTGGATEATPASNGNGGGGSSAGGDGAVDGGEGTDGGAGSGGDGATVGLGGGDPVVAGLPVTIPDRGLPVSTLMLMLLAVVLTLFAMLFPPLLARRRLSIAGRPRGPASRRHVPRGPRPAFSKRIPRPPLPNVNLRDAFRKGGRASGAPEDS